MNGRMALSESDFVASEQLEPSLGKVLHAGCLY